ncbi:MAG: hypothetical protein LQ344_001894 [Seirophora lacunosa]|nr:MAG: hypothetical protein LQ344_001894 [Seirophora lacunosa]
MGPPRTSKHLRPERTSTSTSNPKPKPSTNKNSSSSSSSPLPHNNNNSNDNNSRLHSLHQTLLTSFTTAFPARFNAALKADIQSLKTHLFARDFAAAFRDEDALEAYAVRWSAGRALAYLDLLCTVDGLREGLLRCGGEEEEDGIRRRGKVLCLGGGAGAEVVALAGWMGWSRDAERESEGRGMDVLAVDIAPWSSPLRALHAALTTAPPLSAYAGAAVKAGNRALVPAEAFSVEFRQRDVLEVEGEELGEMCQSVGMVMLMFTLNELYSISKAKTTRLLLGLTSHVVKGGMLCVVDSPGSYSTVGLGKGGVDGEADGGKKYPMQWLLDHTLLEGAKEGKGDGAGGRKWEKVHEQASRWFRLGEGLRYPIALEDMRMQVHVYRRI